VFTNDREKQVPNVQLEVIPPKASESMKEAKEIQVWEYQQNYQGYLLLNFSEER
jgi:hypothetical protein